MSVRPAAGVILVRPSGEVYLARRHPRGGFFPGFHAFFGGAQERQDADVPGLSPLQACALRELFEEGGIWLGPHSPGPVERRQLLERAVTLAELVSRHPVEPAGLREAGVRTTPAYAPVRYAAQFYLAVTEGEPTVWEAELLDGSWWRPADAHSAWERGDILLAPPTLEAVRWLRDGVEPALEELRKEQCYPPVLPLSPGLGYLPLETVTLPPARHTLCLFLGGERQLLVDPATALPDEALAGRTIEEVVFTHHHQDHVGGGEWARARGLPLAAHPETARRLAFPVDRLVEDGHTWELGPDSAGLPWRVRALHTPGHAPGHLALWEERRRFLLAGDLVSGMSTILIDPEEGDMAAYLDSLRRMAALEPRLVVASHGPPFGPGAGIFEKVLAHRLARERRVLDHLKAEPQSLEGLAAEVYADTPGAHPELARRSLLAHLRKLVREGQAREGASGYSLSR